jgi:hypothetical protein
MRYVGWIENQVSSDSVTHIEPTKSKMAVCSAIVPLADSVRYATWESGFKPDSFQVQSAFIVPDPQYGM